MGVVVMRVFSENRSDSATNFGRSKMSQVTRFWRMVWQEGMTSEMVNNFRLNDYVKIISLGVVANTIFELFSATPR